MTFLRAHTVHKSFRPASSSGCAPLLFCLFLLQFGAAHAQNLVSNGTFNAVSTAGWQAVGCCGGYGNELGSAQNGARGDWLSIGGSLSQTLNTVAGQRYLLSFATRGDNPGQSPRMATMLISWGGQLIGSYTSPNNRIWTYPKFLLDATGPTELRFATAFSLQHPELDDVVVVPAPVTQPAVVLTSPPQGAAYVMGQSVPFTVNVTAGQGRSIVRVDYFHSGTTAIVSTATAPYSAAWTNVPPGSWNISARVTDNAGDTTTAVLKQIAVATRPTVYWVSPAEGAVFATGENVPVSALVTNNDGRITRLTLRAGSTLLAEFSGPIGNGVYSSTWLGAPRGNFILEATGYDAGGASFSSALRSVSVLPPAVLDQAQTNSSSGVWLPTGTIYAQTFTPAVDGELHHIELRVSPNDYRQVHPVNITVVETVQGTPTGRVLGEAVIPGVEQNFDVPRSAFFREAAPLLRAGVLYAFIVRPTFQTGGVTLLTASTDDPYRRGAIWRQQGTGAWQQAEREPNLYADMVFATYMVPRAVPVVSILGPIDGGTFQAGDSIELLANVTDADSTNVWVEFFAGGIPIGTVTNPPFETLWVNVPAGRFPITAVATDELGLSGRSSAVLIHVQPTDALPRVSVQGASTVEGARTNLLPVSLVLSAAATNVVTVGYATADATALAGSDYQAVTGTVVFPVGITNIAITIPIYGDQINEPHESFVVNLFSVAGANFDQVQAVCVILDDEFGPGKVHHFSFSGIPSPQTTNRPFSVSVSALDISNNLVTNFSGDVGLSFLAAPTDLGNTLLNGVPHATTPDTGGTIGYAFTPSTNLVLTGVRHYAGYYMSLWTDDGVLLLKHELPRTAGFWVDSTLAAPVALKAGKTYRIAFFTGGLTWYGLAASPGNFPHGTFGPAFQTAGEGFPNGSPPSSWPLADLRYRIDAPLAAPVIPASVNQFVNGRWSGALSFASVPAAAMQLRAEDGLGHIGLSGVFSMNQAPTVQIESPGSNAVLYPPANVTITAVAADADGTVARVEFFRAGTLLGALTSAPFTMVWSNVPPGEHTVTVRAMDNFGAAATATTFFQVASVPNAIATVRFDPPAIPGGSRSIAELFEQGFAFSCGNRMGHTDSSVSPNRPQSGSAYLQFLIGSVPLIITHTRQTPFSLISADLAEYSTLFATPREIVFQGWREDGTAVSQTFITDGIIDGVGVLEDFQTFAFAPEFAGLVRVEVWTDLYSLENFRIAADFPDAPTVRVVAPLDQTGVAPLDVVFAASVLASTGNVTRVDFVVDGSFVGSAFDIPFRLSWPFLALGTHTVTARAFNDLGLEVTSDPVTFQITAKPVVTLIAPINGAIVTIGEPATLQAQAVDEDGTIAEVIYFDGTNILGTVTSAPFWLTWSNFAAGPHSLHALAIDNLGVAGVSAPIQVLANIPPSVSLTSPSNHLVLQPGAIIHFSAVAQDADGSISFVEFYLGTNLVGCVLTPPYELDWVSTGTGPFCATAVAVDNHGAARSDRMAGRVNQSPSATILLPTPSSAFIAPAAIQISGFAQDNDGRVRTIFVSAGAGFTARFDVAETGAAPVPDCNSVEPGTPHQVPFTCVWTNVPPGLHTIRAYAVDSDGASSAITETTVFNFNYPPVTAAWTGTNVVRRRPRIRFVQEVTVSNPTTTAFASGQLVVYLDRRSILRGVRVLGATRIRRGIFMVTMPPVPAAGTASVEIQYTAPNRRRIPEPILVPMIR